MPPPIIMVHRNTGFLTALSFGLSLLGCAAAEEPLTCDAGSDCPSGACDDGICVDGGAGGSGAASGGGSGGDAGGGGGDTGGQGAAGGGGSLCGQNGDLAVERAEITLEPGLSAKFMTALDASFDTAGEPGEDGARVWDLDGSFGGDHLALVETLPLAGTWYADLFAGATYAVRLSAPSTLLGVFEPTEQSLLLRGVVSPEDGLTRTELTYDPPAVILSFPVAQGESWSSTSTVSGLAEGFFSTYTEAYDTQVDAHGELLAPFGAFDVVRLSTVLTRTVGVIPTVTRTYAFAAECFGTVAKVTSQTGETNVEFTNAAELSRLAP